MNGDSSGLAYGPVPSRRLGQSLGVNTVPAKHCTYSCLYCQVGRTVRTETDRRPFRNPEVVARAVTDRLEQLARKHQTVNYLSIVPDGEPTLDSNLGRIISLLRPLGLPVAVLTNSSLLWRGDVREELSEADWVSLKIDSLDERNWRRINRPHPGLRLADLIEGMLTFRRTFTGTLVTETMLVRGINDTARCMRQVAVFLSQLQPSRAYLSIPTRPPADSSAAAPDEQVVDRMHHILAAAFEPVECLTGSEGNTFGATADIVGDILGITAVHPMRAEAIKALLDRAGASWMVIEHLLDDGLLTQTEYKGQIFYLRRFSAGRRTEGSTA